MRLTQILLGICIACVLPNSNSWARSYLDERLTKLENIINNQMSVDVINQLEVLQQEARELHGLLEEQEHKIKLLNQRQEKLFLDLDERISHLSKMQNNQNIAHNPATINKNAEKTAYEAAYQLMDAKKYADAITAFQDFLWQYPDGRYVPNAYYWLGEIYLVEWYKDRKVEQPVTKAINSFKQVTAKFKDHHKAVDALLKLGLIEVDRKNWDVAKSLLSQLIEQYPDSSRARLAESRLQRLKQEGHI